MRHIMLTLLCVTLAACTTPEQIAAQQAMQKQADFQTCQGYGFRVKTEAFSNCLLSLEVARQERINRATYSYGFGYGYHRHPHFRYSHWY